MLSLNRSFPTSFLSSLRLLTATTTTTSSRDPIPTAVAAKVFTSSSFSSFAAAAVRPCTTSYSTHHRRHHHRSLGALPVDLQQHLRHQYQYQHQYSSSTGNIFTASSLYTPNRKMSSSTTNSCNNKVFQAWRVEEQDDGTFVGSEQTLPLPTRDNDGNDDGKEKHEDKNKNNMILIKVTHSSLNYKDALSSSGTKGGVTRNFPHTPGIDAAGYIVNDNSDNDDDGRSPSTSVLVTGYVSYDKSNCILSFFPHLILSTFHFFSNKYIYNN